MIFGTDWPGVPGPKANALALTDLDLERETLEKILYKNALRVYALEKDSKPLAKERIMKRRPLDFDCPVSYTVAKVRKETTHEHDSRN
jgi:hypothetical protein